jgi:hypothetical protein
MICSFWLCVEACQEEYVGIPFFVTSALHHGSGQSYLSCRAPHEGGYAKIPKILHEGVIYWHISLTVPAMFRTTFYRNAEVLLSALMRCGVQCLDDFYSAVRGKTLRGGLHHGDPHARPQWAVPSPSACARHQWGHGRRGVGSPRHRQRHPARGPASKWLKRSCPSNDGPSAWSARGRPPRPRGRWRCGPQRSRRLAVVQRPRPPPSRGERCRAPRTGRRWWARSARSLGPAGRAHSRGEGASGGRGAASRARATRGGAELGFFTSSRHGQPSVAAAARAA